ncbi:MAG TPA: homocysteine S-methyltransferase family protein [Ktedonobacteraceae bacterium]
MDGGMGTEILRRGVPTILPLWSAEALLTHPQVVQNIHEEYITAGAEIIITDTFRTTQRAFAKRGIADKAHDTTLLACQLVHQAIEQVHPRHSVFIAGSMAPLEDCYSPQLTPPYEDLLKEHEAYAKDLTEGGVDFLLLETMITLRETLAAIQAAKKLMMPFAVSFCTNAQGQLLGGEPLEQVVKEVEGYDPLFLGVNCVTPEIATKTLQALKTFTNRPLSVYAQGDGIPHEDQGWEFLEAQQIGNYLLHAKQWIADGAHLIGGCCGTSPAYIEQLRKLL